MCMCAGISVVSGTTAEEWWCSSAKALQPHMDVALHLHSTYHLCVNHHDRQ